MWWSSLESVGPVDEVEIQVLQLEILQRLQEGRLHVLWVMPGVPQFGGDEDVLSSQRLKDRHGQTDEHHKGFWTRNHRMCSERAWTSARWLKFPVLSSLPCWGRASPAELLRSLSRCHRWQHSRCGGNQLPAHTWLLASPVLSRKSRNCLKPWCRHNRF